jgi:hypothetical protein
MAVVREMLLLVKAVCSGDDLARILSTYPHIRIASTFLNVGVPSYLVDILRKPATAATPEVLEHIEQNRREVLHTCFVDAAVITMLTRDRSLISHPEEYLACFLTPRFSLFDREISLIAIMVTRATWHLRTLEPTVSALTDHCLFLPSALPVLSIFYRALLKGTVEAELREFETVQRIFLTGQSIENARHFAAELRTAMPFCDIPTMLQKYFLARENHFVVMFVVIVMVALSHDSRGGLISEFAKIHEKSRIPQWVGDGGSRGLTIR